MADEQTQVKPAEAASQQSEAGKETSPAPAESQESSQVTETAPSGTEEGKEPGGADGQAVYQRKLYRENKQLQDRLQAQAIEQARLAERLKLAEETLSKQQTVQAQPRIYSVAELEAAVADQRITREDAERYKFEVIVPRQVQTQTEAREKARQEHEAKERPLTEARKSLGEYTRLNPWLADPANTKTQEIAQRYNHLVTNRGLPQNEITTELAISQVLGPIDKVTQRREVDSLTSRNTGTFAEAGAGGVVNNTVTGNALSKVPKDLVDGWKKMGVTDPKTLEDYAKFHLAKATRRRATIGV